MMRLIFYYPHNRLLRHDGDEFAARALDCSRFWTGSGHKVRAFAIPKGNDAAKRQYVMTILAAQCNSSIDRVAFFCHGTATWFDAGFTTATIAQSGAEWRRVLTPDARIGLYCCLTGRDTTGLAASLSRCSGAPVMAHTTSGHTTRNPYKRLFDSGTQSDIWPKTKAAFAAWRAKLSTMYGAFEALEDYE
jgi:hypothetical protein